MAGKMSDVGKELYGLERKLLGKVESIDPKDLTGFRAYLNKSSTSLLMNWDAPGAVWERMTGEIEVFSSKANDPILLKKKEMYRVEVSVFFISGTLEPPTWAVTGQSWRDQQPNSFVALARIGDGSSWLSGWIPLQGSPFMSASDVEDDLAQYVKRAKKARKSAFGLGMIVGAIAFSLLLYGGFKFVVSDPTRFQDAVEWVDSKVDLPDISKIPNNSPGGSERETLETEDNTASEPTSETKPSTTPVKGQGDDTSGKTGGTSPMEPSSASENETVKDLERALAEAHERNQELDSEVARNERELAARRKDLAAVRQGAGLSLPPCWPDSSGSYTEFIYDVHVSDAGIKVSKVYPAHRETDYQKLPVSDASLGVYHDRHSFIAAFEPLYQMSKTQSCRHYVHLLEGPHADLNTYKVQRDAVEGLFYIHRPVWNK